LLLLSDRLFLAFCSARDRSSNRISVLLGSAEFFIPELKVAVRVPVIVVIRKSVLLLGAGERAAAEMPRMKPAALLLHSKRKKGPARRSVTNIVICATLVILFLLSTVVIQKRKAMLLVAFLPYLHPRKTNPLLLFVVCSLSWAHLLSIR